MTSGPQISETDYLSVIDIVSRFQACEDRNQLRDCFEYKLLSLLDCQAYIMAWVDYNPDDRIASRVEPFFSVNFPGGDNAVIEYFQRGHQTLFDKLAITGRTVLASSTPAGTSDIDEAVFGAESSSQNDTSEHIQASSFLQSVGCSIGVTDQPGMEVASVFFRTRKRSIPLNSRELKIVELIQPSLIQCLYSLAATEELQRIRALSEVLMNDSLPTAFLSQDGTLIQANSSFERLTGVLRHNPLPRSLWEKVQQEISVIGSNRPLCKKSRMVSHHRLAEKSWRLKLVKLRMSDEVPPSYMLRLQPLEEHHIENILLHEGVSLTAREMEVALLVRDGVSSRLAAERLLISENTIKTHLKNIHKKFGTNSRASLVSKLNGDSNPGASQI